MVHTNRLAATHEKFADFLSEEFAKVGGVPNGKMIPCLLMDGESSLGEYGKVS